LLQDLNDVYAYHQRKTLLLRESVIAGKEQREAVGGVVVEWLIIRGSRKGWCGRCLVVEMNNY